ncbi:hypothetical protein [Rhodococcus phage REQ1]|uniref:hypothetical protein n=1 Tax=Rhodococcus phage REQ1 TaxID=1109712 RepID=UPI00023EEBF1|nr:hypothetical protein RoPhREQ1_gp16 [Rhodococcus phage REQ1]AEV52012.1 hypothetical protein [Rhodococcus phage REQ1]
MTPEMRRLAAWITENYSNSILDVIAMTAPIVDPATLVDFQKITMLAERHHHCKACGKAYPSLTGSAFCTACLTTLYVVPQRI